MSKNKKNIDELIKKNNQCGDIQSNKENTKWTHCEQTEETFKKWPKWKQDIYKTF